MILYHGSNITIEKPEIIAPDRMLDFGTGFHLTASIKQAESWALRTADRRGTGKPIITVFEFDEIKQDKLKVLTFETANKKWLNFVANNRDDIVINEKWDLVIGPAANDQTMPVIRLFIAKVYTVSETIQRLLPQKLDNQYTFKTEKSLQYLTFKEVIEK